eukprot:PhF_6_TR913/c0_g1_i3/m.1514
MFDSPNFEQTASLSIYVISCNNTSLSCALLVEYPFECECPESPQKCLQDGIPYCIAQRKDKVCTTPLVTYTPTIVFKGVVHPQMYLRHPQLYLETDWISSENGDGMTNPVRVAFGEKVDLAILRRRTWHVFVSLQYSNVAIAVFVDSTAPKQLNPSTEPITYPWKHIHVRRLEEPFEYEVAIVGMQPLPLLLVAPDNCHAWKNQFDHSMYFPITQELQRLKIQTSCGMKTQQYSIVEAKHRGIILGYVALDDTVEGVRWSYYVNDSVRSGVFTFPTFYAVHTGVLGEHPPCTFQHNPPEVILTIPPHGDIGTFMCYTSAGTLTLTVGVLTLDCYHYVEFEYGPELLWKIGDHYAVSPNNWLIQRSTHAECLKAEFQATVLPASDGPLGEGRTFEVSLTHSRCGHFVCWQVRLMSSEAPVRRGHHIIQLQSMEFTLHRTIHVVTDDDALVLSWGIRRKGDLNVFRATSCTPVYVCVSTVGKTNLDALTWSSHGLTLHDTLSLQLHRARALVPLCLVSGVIEGQHRQAHATLELPLMSISNTIRSIPNLVWNQVFQVLSVWWEDVPFEFLRCSWSNVSNPQSHRQDCFQRVVHVPNCTVSIWDDRNPDTKNTLTWQRPLPRETVSLETCQNNEQLQKSPFRLKMLWFLTLRWDPFLHLCEGLGVVHSSAVTSSNILFASRVLGALHRILKLSEQHNFNWEKSILAVLEGISTFLKSLQGEDSSFFPRLSSSFCDLLKDCIPHGDNNTYKLAAPTLSTVYENQWCHSSWVVTLMSTFPTFTHPLLDVECSGNTRSCGPGSLLVQNKSITTSKRKTKKKYSEIWCCVQFFSIANESIPTVLVAGFPNHKFHKDLHFSPTKAEALSVTSCYCLETVSGEWHKNVPVNCSLQDCVVIGVNLSPRAFPWAVASLVVLFVIFCGLLMGGLLALLRPGKLLRKFAAVSRRVGGDEEIVPDTYYSYVPSPPDIYPAWVEEGESVLDSNTAGETLKKIATPGKML